MTYTTQELVNQAKSAIDEWDVPTAMRELAARPGIILLDVREPAEFSDGHLDGACNIPRGVLEFKVDPTYPACEKTLLDKNLEILVYCKSGGRSALAAHVMRLLGYGKVASLAGGIDAWTAHAAGTA